MNMKNGYDKPSIDERKVKFMEIKTDIHTERLVLRPSRDERDLENYLAHLEAENEYFIQYGYERSDELIAAIDFHSAPVCYYTIFLKDTNDMAGYAGITPGTDEAPGSFEIYIFKEYRRKHIAFEAGSALIQNFFEGKLTGEKESSLSAETLTDNEASIRLLESLDFKREAVGLRLCEFDADKETGISVGYSTAYYVTPSRQR